MELMEFFNLIKKHRVIFGMVFLAVFLGGLIWHNKESELYLASTAINISRVGQVETSDYQYDQFYRLQADEKFGKNVVEWVGDPGMMANNKKDFSKFVKGNWGDISAIKTVQFAPNYIKVKFKSKTYQSAIIFGEVLGKNLNQKTEELNIEQKEKNWFKVTSDKSQAAKNDINIYFVLLVASSLGILLGIFGVLIIHYFSENEDRN